MMDGWVKRIELPWLERLCSVVSLGCRHKSTPHQHHYKRRGEEREEKRHEEMENDMWPFCFSKSHAAISYHLSFFLHVSCLPFSLSASFRPSDLVCTFSSLFCLNEPRFAENRDRTAERRKHVSKVISIVSCTFLA